MSGVRELLFRWRRRPSEPPRLTLPPVPTGPELLAAVDRVEQVVRDGRVQAAVQYRVSRVTSTVRETVPRLDALGLGNPQAHAVVATAVHYLPDAVDGYLRLPRDWADTRPVDRGRTSLMVLCDQLDLLAATMDQVFDAVCRQDAAALVAHGRFLADKFRGPTENPLDPGRPAAGRASHQPLPSPPSSEP